MSSVWSAARFVGDAVLAAFAWLPPLAALVALSAVLGVVLLGAFRLVTPQRRLRRVKDQMSACVYELRIFSASPLLVLAAQGRAVGFTAVYLALALPSLLVLAPVVGVVASRAALSYELRPLQVGEETLVWFSLDHPPASRPEVTASGKGLRVIPPLVMVDRNGHVEGYVRLRATGSGKHSVSVRVGSVAARKTVQVGTGHAPVSWRRAREDDASTLLSLEPPLPHSGALTGITVDYPAREPPWPGVPWWVHLLVISMAAALALRRRLGVVF